LLIDTSYEKLMEEYLKLAPEGIDTRQGGIYYDAGAGFLFLLSRFYTDLNHLYDQISLTSAQGEYLDDRGRDFGMERNAATKAVYEYNAVIEEGGRPPEIGDRFFWDGHFFVVTPFGSETVLLAEKAGSSENGIADEGTLAVPVESARGLSQVVFGRQKRPLAQDGENDDSFRTRLRERLAGPAENGNRQHYKTWCEEEEGVGAARIFLAEPDEETGVKHVKGVILDPQGKDAAADIVMKLQNKIDPGKNGSGEGVANIGAIFKAIAPAAVEIRLSVCVKKNDGYTAAQVQEEMALLLADYFKELNLAAQDSYWVAKSKIAAKIAQMKSIDDYAVSSLVLMRNDTQVTDGAEIDVAEYAVPLIEDVSYM
jgi:uncharacterized phage protein gp47/JayE